MTKKKKTKKEKKKVAEDSRQDDGLMKNVYLMDLDSLTKLNTPIVGTMLVVNDGQNSEIGVSYLNNSNIQFSYYSPDGDSKVNITFKAFAELIKKLAK